MEGENLRLSLVQKISTPPTPDDSPRDSLSNPARLSVSNLKQPPDCALGLVSKVCTRAIPHHFGLGEVPRLFLTSYPAQGDHYLTVRTTARSDCQNHLCSGSSCKARGTKGEHTRGQAAFFWDVDATYPQTKSSCPSLKMTKKSSSPDCILIWMKTGEFQLPHCS